MCCCPGEGVGTEKGGGERYWTVVPSENFEFVASSWQANKMENCLLWLLFSWTCAQGEWTAGGGSEGALGDCRLVACCGWPLNFWRDFLLQFAATLQAKLFAKLSLRRNAPRRAKSTKQATFQLTAWTHSNFNCLPANVTPPPLPCPLLEGPKIAQKYLKFIAKVARAKCQMKFIQISCGKVSRELERKITRAQSWVQLGKLPDRPPVVVVYEISCHSLCYCWPELQACYDCNSLWQLRESFRDSLHHLESPLSWFLYRISCLKWSQ